jgi:hypothetical protein
VRSDAMRMPKALSAAGTRNSSLAAGQMGLATAGPAALVRTCTSTSRTRKRTAHEPPLRRSHGCTREARKRVRRVRHGSVCRRTHRGAQTLQGPASLTWTLHALRS